MHDGRPGLSPLKPIACGCSTQELMPENAPTTLRLHDPAERPGKNGVLSATGRRTPVLRAELVEEGSSLRHAGSGFAV
jgi:hypothetical protein